MRPYILEKTIMLGANPSRTNAEKEDSMQLLILLFSIVYMLFIYPKLYNKMFKS